MKKSLSSGFTLIEILVVIAIIGFLASLAFGSLVAARKKSEDARTRADVEQIKLAMELYEQENGGYPNPQDPSSSVPAQASASIYCVGRSTCTHKGIPRNGVAPLYVAYFKDVLDHYSPLLAATFNAFPKYKNAGDQVKYTFKNAGTGLNEITEGVVFSCADENDPNRARVAGTVCPLDKDVFIEWALHKTGGINKFKFQEGVAGLATVGGSNTDCPDLGHGSRNCETDWTDLPGEEPTETDASPGTLPPSPSPNPAWMFVVDIGVGSCGVKVNGNAVLMSGPVNIPAGSNASVTADTGVGGNEIKSVSSNDDLDNDGVFEPGETKLWYGDPGIGVGTKLFSRTFLYTEKYRDVYFGCGPDSPGGSPSPSPSSSPMPSMGP
ncbi:MAG: prepilin-type N-terminal cleavage/methylation domain-containing protein [bacterium]|nr:prepilin-type N-terminal cleavage/methylation domain-containing protein [bacterium]